MTVLKRRSPRSLPSRWAGHECGAESGTEPVASVGRGLAAVLGAPVVQALLHELTAPPGIRPPLRCDPVWAGTFGDLGPLVHTH
ncbi:hypothetical protein ABIB15_003033 [Marisediminicola sp. UYEF4]|uniref:hypothetical protein n=1 Tax=Marisediminicola sp. UYEF4 TaxID=1756384 RepID=UPI00339A0B1C